MMWAKLGCGLRSWTSGDVFLCLSVLVHAFSGSESDLLDALQWKEISNSNWKQI